MKTVSGASAYDDPNTGQVIIIILHQAIHVPHLEVNLLCPMQMRVNDVKVSEIPKHLADNPTDKTHALTIEDDDLVIPLSLMGVKSYFNTRKPTHEEFHSCRQVEFTYQSPQWNPQDTR
jgi:hypothetical protein